MARRIGRKIQHQHLGLGVGIANGLLQLVEEFRLTAHGDMAQIGP